MLGFCDRQSEIYTMKNLLWLTLFLMACGGSLSDEQRKKLHEGMEQQKIVQVTDSEVMTAALGQGQTVFQALEKVKFNPSKVDSVAQQYKAKIRWIKPGSANAGVIEQQLIEAYISAIATGSLQENIQKIRKEEGSDYDSVVYSKPIVTPMPDGVENLEGVWNIYLSKKQVILTIGSH